MKPIFLAVLAGALFGAATPAGKFLLDALPTFEVAAILYLGAALAVVIPVMREPESNHSIKQIGGRRGLKLLLALLCGGVCAPIFFLMGLKAASAASVSMWLPLEAVFTSLLALLIFKEHIGRLQWLGLAGVTLAATLLSYGEGEAGLKAVVFVGMSCLLWALDNNLTSVIDEVSPARITLFKGIVGGIINLSTAFALEKPVFHWHPIVIGLTVGALSYGLSLTLYIRAAQEIGASRAQLFFATAPFWGATMAFAFLAEPAGPTQLFAMLLLVASLVALSRDKHSHSHDHESMSHVHMHTHGQKGDGHHDHAHDASEKLTGSTKHSHWHTHEPVSHSHQHWPDLHHRHLHKSI